MRTGYACPLYALATLLLTLPVVRTHFVLRDKFVGNDFYAGFRWETFDDPTHGRVNYVDQGTAIAKNLTQATENKFFMRADATNVVSPGSRGRDSVRVSSYNSYDESVIVLDLQHMPEGCATWPAFWTLSAQGPWPHGGEIDIVEGVNLQTANLASLHTTPSCMMPQQRTQAGSTVSTNCDASANFNQGCGTRSAMGTSYGSVFNTLGGGYYVMSRTRDEGIKIWFWRRDDPTVPADVRGTYGAEAQKPLEFMFGGPPSITPDSSWGVPDAYFPVGDFCDYNSHFDAHMMVFDLTFCGDWAGGVYSDSGCGGDCVDLVDNHPDAFAAAYWEINSLRVYVPQ